MNALRRWWKLALAVVVAVVAAQLAVSLLVRTRRVHNFLVAELSTAFGRTVEVGHFEARLLPRPTLDASAITVGEDSAFGNEYFLRAEGFSAGLRWSGLLRGHFEFGALAFSRPSLILVRNAESRWNLERWLPPAKAGSTPAFYGPQAATSSNHLRRIEFDEGRVSFKIENDKQAFAFTNVSGEVEQVAPGRWRLLLEATPWRSGVALQSTGTIRVRGDLAGTSARLQPAQIQMHWGDASLADLFRLYGDQDYGVRGLFALDASLHSGVGDADVPQGPGSGTWTFSVQARAARIHRWDLAERGDNPRVNAALKGSFFSDGRPMQPAHFAVESPQSNARGEFSVGSSPRSDLLIRLDSMGVQGTDLLAWYRAFHQNVDEGISAQQFFTGAATLRSWPPQVESAGFSSAGGLMKIPGIDGGLQIWPLRGGREREKLIIEPVHVSWSSAPSASAEEKGGAGGKRRGGADIRSTADLGLTYDFASANGGLTVEGRTSRIQQVLRIAQAFGRTLNHGWEAMGEANASLQWDWSPGRGGRWNGRVGFSRAQLQIAGLNQSLQVDDAAMVYDQGRRTVEIAKAQGFGANWRGEIAEGETAALISTGDAEPKWQFRLRADKLDAAELDRWVGPRARPGWLQRLMGSLLGTANAGSNTTPSELLRRVNAEGELRVDELSIEKLHLGQFSATGSLHNLQVEIREAEAQWAGGTVRGAVKARFAPKASYDVEAELDRVNLAQLPPPFAARLGGVASGKIRMVVAGVGRDELLQSLDGRAELRIKGIELRGWDVNASMADGMAHSGVSRWPSGGGTLLFRDRSVILNDLRLEDGRQVTLVNGRITFTQNAELSMEDVKAGKRSGNVPGAGRVLKISGPLDGPSVSVENAVGRQPAH